MSLLKLIKDSEKYALTDEDIYKYMNGDVHIIQYSEPAIVKNLEDIFDKSKNVILFIPVENSNNGHWVCLFQIDIGISYFCPYGFSPSENIKYSPFLMHTEDKNDYALIYLIKRYKGKFSYNKYKIQELKIGINVCGRHCIARLLHKDMSDLEYYNYINSMRDSNRLTPDELVSLIMLW